MQMLPKWVLPPTLPSVYERESFTALEMVAKVYGAMNELINEYNKFADSANKRMEDFEAATEEQFNLFAVGLRQEFQDFIDVVDLKLQAMQQQVDNIDTIAIQAVNNAIMSGAITIENQYDEANESLDVVVTGG